MTKAQESCSCAGMSYVLSEDKRQQVLTLGRLGWSLRRIEEATSVRRERASAYLKVVRCGGASPGAAAEPPVKAGHCGGGVHRPGAAETGRFGGGEPLSALLEGPVRQPAADREAGRES